MGEVCREMGTLMVCCDYRHAGMMSCSLRVYACISSQILHNIASLFASVPLCTLQYVHISVFPPVFMCLHSVRVRGGCLLSVCLCDIICWHVLPCTDHNPAATGSRAGLWVEGSNSVTSLPGQNWSNLSHPPLSGSSMQPLIELLTPDSEIAG